MRRILALLILVAGLGGFAAAAVSQEAESPIAPAKEASGRTPEDIANMLAKRLSLTEEQKTKLLPIIVERRRRIQDVWTTSEQFVRQKQGQERGINKESDRHINALLNGDQQKAYLAWQQERKVKRRLQRAQSENSP